MFRRTALKKAIVLVGSISIAPELLAAALADVTTVLAKVPAQRLDLLAELADTILPSTDSPGAKAAKVQDFIAAAVEACFSESQRQSFWAGLDHLEAECIQRLGKSFLACSESERIQYLQYVEDHPSATPPFFQLLKELTLHGYFTSEIGATQALNYDPVPGVWIPDLTIDDQTKAWTPMF